MKKYSQRSSFEKILFPKAHQQNNRIIIKKKKIYVIFKQIKRYMYIFKYQSH